MMKRIIIGQLTAVLLSIICSQANAIPIKFTHTGTVGSVSGDAAALTAVGDVITIEVIADNGGSDLISQVWNPVAHTVSATFSAGSYLASFVEAWYPSGSGFTTNGAGDLIASQWFGTGSSPISSTDNFGTGVYLYNVGVFVSSGGQISSDSVFADISTWSIEVVNSVPLPGTITLLGLGLAGLGWSRRKKA